MCASQVMLDEMVTVGEVPDWSIENTVISKENSWDMIYKHKKEKGYQDGQLEVCWMTPHQELPAAFCCLRGILSILKWYLIC